MEVVDAIPTTTTPPRTHIPHSRERHKGCLLLALTSAVGDAGEEGCPPPGSSPGAQAGSPGQGTRPGRPAQAKPAPAAASPSPPSGQNLRRPGVTSDPGTPPASAHRRRKPRSAQAPVHPPGKPHPAGHAGKPRRRPRSLVLPGSPLCWRHLQGLGRRRDSCMWRKKTRL
ncbi:translation initiation factor IF-2-like [Onychomys torridus]|uniref:translation initiation factor IF-2-like n=1 Tax=Onychomys torridus TaxID=38674 RepID=UPI00167F5AFA|nr:translation initiation factor IF-2-like [Onychomys torridus]